MCDEIDTRNAIAAAKEALKSWSKTTKQERMDALQRLFDAEMKYMNELIDGTVEEYGAPQDRAKGSNELSANITSAL